MKMWTRRTNLIVNSIFSQCQRTWTRPKYAQERFSSGGRKSIKKLYSIDKDVFAALATFKQLNGHLIVPVQTVVPAENQWPEQCYNMKLGRHVQVIRQKHQQNRLQPQQVVELNEMDFAWHANTKRFELYFMTCLRIYKQLHGHVEVPIHFVIPDEEPWPKHTHAYKFGVAVHNIRYGGNHGELVEQYEKELTLLGFSCAKFFESHWQNTILPALENFHAVHGHSEVPPAFVIPENDCQWYEKLWGLKLGSAINSMKVLGCFKEFIVQDNDKLKRIGFLEQFRKVYGVQNLKMDHRTKHLVDDNILLALRTFKEVHGHLLVPHSMIIPSGSSDIWPEKLWGIKLGLVTQSIRIKYRTNLLLPSHIKDLDEMDFAWSVKDKVFEIFFLKCLQIYKQIYRHVDIPSYFVVPNEDPWPRYTYGYKLGVTLKNIIRHGSYSKQVALHHRDLEDIRFTDNFPKMEMLSDKVYLALKIYKDIHGHLLVPRSMVVPSNLSERWPKEIWGMRLGSVVFSIRQNYKKKLLYPDQIKKLDEMDFAWAQRDKVFEVFFLQCLRIYKQLYGHVDIPHNFVVPNDKPWPTYTHGYEFGRTIKNLRRNGSHSIQLKQHKKELKELGFISSISEKRWDENVLPALENFHSIYNQCVVDNSFVVPESDHWDKRLWGMKLGYIVNSIKNAEVFKEFIIRDAKRLEKIGFLEHFQQNFLEK